MVFLKVKPRISSLRLGKFQKLAFKYCGPYLVNKRIGEQAYEISLPPHLKIHNVFHVSPLKKYIPSNQYVLQDDDLEFVSQGKISMESEQILEIQERP